MTSARINSIAYQGNGTGGILHVNDLELSLNDRNGPAPSIGTTKNDQLALADRGKVFAFGPVRTEAENLATVPPAGDDASIEIRRSILNWPTPFEVNFMTGHSPSWKRHLYYRVRWKKSSGASLEMLWRYEQFFYPGNGWASGFMTREGSTGLIRVDIKEVTGRTLAKASFLEYTRFSASFCRATLAKISKALYPRRGGKSVGARSPLDAPGKLSTDSRHDR